MYFFRKVGPKLWNAAQFAGRIFDRVVPVAGTASLASDAHDIINTKKSSPEGQPSAQNSGPSLK